MSLKFSGSNQLVFCFFLFPGEAPGLFGGLGSAKFRSIWGAFGILGLGDDVLGARKLRSMRSTSSSRPRRFPPSPVWTASRSTQTSGAFRKKKREMRCFCFQPPGLLPTSLKGGGRLGFAVLPYAPWTFFLEFPTP